MTTFTTICFKAWHLFRLLQEICVYSWVNQSWWLLPLFLLMLLATLIAVIPQVSLPYIYTMF